MGYEDTMLSKIIRAHFRSKRVIKNNEIVFVDELNIENFPDTTDLDKIIFGQKGKFAKDISLL